jgi:hypothetical protein
MKLEKRLELLKEKVQEDDFLNARGLGNEIPFWIFDYPPEKELLIRETVDKLKQNLLENKLSADQINQFESNKGSDELLNKLKIMLKSEIVKKTIQTKTGNILSG